MEKRGGIYKMFIIAEAGSNHDGELDRAKKLIDIAVNAGADAVKFQLVYPFKKEWIDVLIDYCGDRIEFMASPFSDEGIEALRGKVKHWKIASTEAADKNFVHKIFEAANGDQVIISDGAVDKIDYDYDNLVPLVCVIKYPADERDYSNPNDGPASISDYSMHYKGKWGLSDHSKDPSFLPVIATSRGASVIEKHFTDDKKRVGPDHHYAMNPEELKEMIDKVRMAEKIIGNKKLTIKDYVGRKIQWN